MFVNTAGSIVAIKRGVDYTPEFISTSPHLHPKTADAGNGPGYWEPPIGALHVVASTGGPITLWTLKGNTNFRASDLHKLQALPGGLLTKGTYYYRLSVNEGTYFSFPTRPEMITVNGIEGSIKISWNRVKGSEGYTLFRGTTYGVWDYMLDLPLETISVVDDGTLNWQTNTITDFGIPVIIPATAFIVGNVYNIWFKKYTGGNDDVFLGYRPANYPPEL